MPARGRRPASRRAGRRPTTVAPSARNSAAVSAPIPLAAPVMTHTLPCEPAISLRRVVDGLDLGVVVERVRAELAAEARLLEAAERRRHAHRRVRVDRQHAGLDRPRDAQRLGAVARPDRARQPVDRVVGQRAPPPPRRGTGCTTATGPKISSRTARSSRSTGHSTVGGNQKPGPSGALPWIATGAPSGTNERDRLALAGGDQRAHLGRLVERVADAHAPRPSPPARP